MVGYLVEHGFALLCLYGIAASLAFRYVEGLRQSAWAVGGYLALYWILFVPFALGAFPVLGSPHGSVAAAASASATVLTGFIRGGVVLFVNAVALWYSGEYVLTALARALTSDSQIVVRKTYDKAEAAEARHDFETAASLYEQEIASDPEDHEAHRRLGELLVKMGRAREGAARLERALELAEQADERCAAAFRLAEVYHDQLDDPEQALRLYTLIARSHPGNRLARYARERAERLKASALQDDEEETDGF